MADTGRFKMAWEDNEDEYEDFYDFDAVPMEDSEAGVAHCQEHGSSLSHSLKANALGPGLLAESIRQGVPQGQKDFCQGMKSVMMFYKLLADKGILPQHIQNDQALGCSQEAHTKWCVM